jgi:hypothetical protein
MKKCGPRNTLFSGALSYFV